MPAWRPQHKTTHERCLRFTVRRHKFNKDSLSRKGAERIESAERALIMSLNIWLFDKCRFKLIRKREVTEWSHRGESDLQGQKSARLVSFADIANIISPPSWCNNPLPLSGALAGGRGMRWRWRIRMAAAPSPYPRPFDWRCRLDCLICRLDCLIYRLDCLICRLSCCPRLDTSEEKPRLGKLPWHSHTVDYEPFITSQPPPRSINFRIFPLEARTMLILFDSRVCTSHGRLAALLKDVLHTRDQPPFYT